MRRSILAILVALALLGIFGAVAVPSATAQAARVFFNSWVFVTKLTVEGGGATIDAGGLVVTDGGVTVTADDLTVTTGDLVVTAGDATVGGDVTVTGSIVAASYITTGGDVDIDADLTISDSLTVGTDATIGDDLVVSGTTTLVGATDIQGNVTDSGGALTVADNVVIDGAADVVQLTVQGNATQTSNPNLFVVETSAGTDQFTVNATGTAAVTGDLTVGDDTTTNDLTVADFVNITAQAVITLTDGAVLTATGSLQPILAEAGIGIDGGTNIAHVTDHLTLVNIGAQTITFTETTGLISAGNVALGAGDATTLVWANGGWIEIARSNN